MMDGDGSYIWVKLQTYTITITVDATIFKDIGKFRMGIVARDYAGKLLQSKTILR